jgi:hypothetical protein
MKHRYFIREMVEMLGDSGFLRRPFTNASWYINKYMGEEYKNKFLLGRLKGHFLESLDWLCQ